MSDSTFIPFPVLRCKVRVESVTHTMEANGSTSSERVTLVAVYGDSEENKQWSRWTPSASFSMTITNPPAFGKLSKGHEFYVDFTPALPEDLPASA